jgi:uncharacterized protein
MIVVDVNLMLYAAVSGFPQHEQARAWWEQALNAAEDVGLCGPAVFGFFRIVTKLHGVGTAGNLTTDIQLAAFALENDAEMFSNDSGFGRFPGLRWSNPLS